MFNELGQNIDIYIDGSNNINIENLSKGSYTLKIEMSSTTHTRKFIKNWTEMSSRDWFDLIQ